MKKFNAPLKPFVRRLRWESFLKAFYLALAGGMIAAMATMLVMYIFKLGTQWFALIGIVAGVAFVIGVIAYFVMYRTTSREIIRRVDEAGLEERITTMEELWEDTSYIAKLQREDTMRRIKELKPKAVKIFLPMVASIVLLSVSVSAFGFALIPQIPTPVTKDAPIKDDYKLIIPSLDQLPTLLYQAVQNVQQSMPETMVDRIDPDLWTDFEDIMDKVDDLKDKIENGEVDRDDINNEADLDDIIDRLDQILKDQVKGPLLSQKMMEGHPPLRLLAEALVSGTAEDIHRALFSWYFGFDEQLASVVSGVNKTEASAHIKEFLVSELRSMMAQVSNKTTTFGTDRNFIKNSIAGFETKIETSVFAQGSVENLLSQDDIFADFATALMAGDSEGIANELELIKNSMVELGSIKKTALEDVIASLYAVMDVTIDRPTGNGMEDPAWTAVQNLHVKLEERVLPLALVGNADAMTWLNTAFTDATTEFNEAILVNNIDREAFRYVVKELDYIVTGRAMYAHLWNSPENNAYIPEKDLGIAGHFRQVMNELKFSQYTEAVLVQVLFELIEGLETAAVKALENNGNYDSMALLFGADRPTGEEAAEHVRHTDKSVIPQACNNIFDALIVEENIKDVVDDMKDKVDDTKDDLDPDEEEDEDEEPDAGIDSKPPEQEGGTPESGEQEPEQGDQDSSDSSNQTPPGGSENLNDLVFFNPTTGKEETLSKEALEEFKAALDKAIEDGLYTPEEETQLNRYWEYLNQKFSQN